MRTKTVRIDKTKHKTQPFTVTELGRVDKVRAERYKTERTASIGAVRACTDFLAKDPLESQVRILLTNGRERKGWIAAGKVYMGDITETRILLKKAVKSTTKKKK